MILSTRRAVFIGDLRSRVSWASIFDPRRVMTATPADERSAAGVEEDFCRCFSLQAMKLPRTRNRWTERLLIDDAFDVYLEWRDESADVWHAYKRWDGAPAREARASVRGWRRTTCAARPDASASTCTARASTPTTTSSCTWAEPRST